MSKNKIEPTEEKVPSHAPAIPAPEEGGSKESRGLALPSPKVGMAPGVQGEVDQSDLAIPSLNIVQNVGPLSENFDGGQVLYSKEYVLDQPVSIIVLGIKKYFVEDLAYGDETMPKMFHREAEVFAEGGTLEWDGRTPPTYLRAATALLLVRSDKHGEIMPYDFGAEGRWGMAVWYLRKTSYTRAGRNIFTAAATNLLKGLHKGMWSLETRREKIQTNLVWCPMFHQTKATPSEMAAEIEKSILPLNQ